jgi:hypothetical protein
MRFSEAIRLGAMMKPQYFGHYSNVDQTKTCALGAAADGAGLTMGSLDSSWIPVMIHP